MEHATLYVGASGDGAVTLKRYLRVLGFTVSDGSEYDSKTRLAVESFQNDHGLKVDGVVGHDTWRALERCYKKEGGSQEAAYSGYYGEYHEEERGDGENDTIKKIQARLNAIGYNSGNADGIFGARTESAVKDFQRNFGLKVDGIVGKDTWAALFGDSGVKSYGGGLEGGGGNGYGGFAEVKRGCENDSVTELQRRLKACGLYTGNIDGIFGPLTEHAVMKFQEANGLKVDGICGPQTWAKLMDPNNSCSGNMGAGYVGYSGAPNMGGMNMGGMSVGDGRAAGGGTGATFPVDNGFAGGYADNGYAAVALPCGAAAAPSSSAAAYGVSVPGDATRIRSHVDDYPSLWYGDYGNYVKELQERLAHIQHFFGTVSGVFDQETLMAVKAFQKAHGILSDGVVRKGLWELLRVGR